MKKVYVRIMAVLIMLLVLPYSINSEVNVINYTQIKVGTDILFVKESRMVSDKSFVDSLLYDPSIKKKSISYQFDNYKNKIGILESGGNYNAVNRFGYLGKYQFSRRTLRGLVRTGYLKVEYRKLRKFKSSPELQEQAMDALIKHNYDILIKNYKLKKYVGKTVGGVKITVDGMLAAAHLLGPYSVKHFLTTNGSLNSVNVNGVLIRKYDGNGTCITDYIKHFA